MTIAQTLNKIADKIGPNDALAPPPGSERLDGSRTGLDVRPLAEVKAEEERAGQTTVGSQPEKTATEPTQSSTISKVPTFDPAKVTVVYVLGGPGAGKGTQCARLVQRYGCVHLSAGDLLRAEQDRPGSEHGKLIRHCIVEGQVVPMEVTLKLLENAMKEAVSKGTTFFLIDGFPRKMDQAVEFDRVVCPASLALLLICPEDVLLSRLLERGKTSGRADDNEASIRKRFRTFIETSMPVIDYYRSKDKVLEVDSSRSIDAVDHDLVKGLEARLGSERL